jgi:flagellum-specific peptidoglycan hydrolase FlgJ
MPQTIHSFQVGQIERRQAVAHQPNIFAVDWWKIRRNAIIFLQKHGFMFIIMAVMLVFVVAKTDRLTTAAIGSETTNITEKNTGKKRNLKQKPEKVTTMGVEFKTKNNDPTEGVTEVLPARAPLPVRSNAYAADGTAANLFDNVSIFVAPEKADVKVVKSKQEKCWDYVRRFVNVARAERQKFGIPVSITLAQGLLESDAGDSRLTRSANNHFGIKTFNRNVPHVVLKDDTPTDKFKKYNSAWESYRDHSLLLMRAHYGQLQYLSKTDYSGWARGLEKAGYATDKLYAEKLIKIIENLQLYKLDEA